MKKFLLLILSSLALNFTVYAKEDFPNKTIRIVTNLPVGSGPDVYVRKVAAELESKVRQPVVVDNKPGGAGLVAFEHYLSQPADGHTLFFGDFGVFVITPTLHNKDTLISQIKPLTIGYFGRWVIVTPPSITSLAQLRQELRKNPNYGSWAIGSGGHLCGAELTQLLGVDAQHVPYKDQNQWLADTAAGVFPFGCSSVGSTESLHKAGKLNYLAVADNRRDPYYSSLSTVKELTGYHFQTGEVWSAFYIHNNVEPSKALIIENALREVNRSPQIVNQVKNLKAFPADNSSKEMEQLRKNHIDVYKALLKKYNVNIN